MQLTAAFFDFPVKLGAQAMNFFLGLDQRFLLFGFTGFISVINYLPGRFLGGGNFGFGDVAANQIASYYTD